MFRFDTHFSQSLGSAFPCYLAQGKSDDVKRRCAAALDKLSCHPTVQDALMDASVMKSLVGLVSTRDKLALLETPHRYDIADYRLY